MARHVGAVEMVMKRVSDADLRLLPIFSTVAESRGFAATQTELNLSALPISGYVTALEQRLGARLCRRGCSGFALTDKGTVVYREASACSAGATPSPGAAP
jgi:DNA-binding transcriptional LysR family regulator